MWDWCLAPEWDMYGRRAALADKRHGWRRAAHLDDSATAGDLIDLLIKGERRRDRLARGYHVCTAIHLDAEQEIDLTPPCQDHLLQPLLIQRGDCCRCALAERSTRGTARRCRGRPTALSRASLAPPYPRGALATRLLPEARGQGYVTGRRAQPPRSPSRRNAPIGHGARLDYQDTRGFATSLHLGVPHPVLSVRWP